MQFEITLTADEKTNTGSPSQKKTHLGEMGTEMNVV